MCTRRTSPAALAAARTGRGEPDLGPLSDQVALEFCDGAEDGEDEPAAGCGGVDGFSEGPEADAAFSELFDGLQKVSQRST